MDHIIFINYISMDQPINKIPATFSKRFLTQNFAALHAKMTPSTTQPQWMLSHTKRLRLKSSQNGPKSYNVRPPFDS
jgi:hypothetical protein